MYVNVIRYLCDYNLQWTVLVGVCAILFARWARGEVGWTGAALFLWPALSAVDTWLSPLNRYATVNQYDQLAIRYFSSDALSKLVFVLALMVLLSRDKEKFMDRGARIASWFLFANGCWVFAQRFLDPTHCSGENTCGGFIGNPSMNASFSAVLLPLAMVYLPRAWMGPWALATILLVSKSNVGFGVTAAGIGLYALLHLRGKALWAGLMASPLALAVGAVVLGQKFANSGDRLTMWKFFFKLWNVPLTHIIGTGFGTFGVFSINLQGMFHMRENGWWVWIHNDWLQALLEMGAIGVVLMFLAFFVACSKLWLENRKPFLASLLLYGIAMSMNYLQHLAPTALFGAWLMVVALKKDEVCVRIEPSYNGA